MNEALTIIYNLYHNIGKYPLTKARLFLKKNGIDVGKPFLQPQLEKLAEREATIAVPREKLKRFIDLAACREYMHLCDEIRALLEPTETAGEEERE